jgi:hypothetical protein
MEAGGGGTGGEAREEGKGVEDGPGMGVALRVGEENGGGVTDAEIAGETDAGVEKATDAKEVTVVVVVGVEGAGVAVAAQMVAVLAMVAEAAEAESGQVLMVVVDA